MPVRCQGMVGFGQVAVERPLVAYTGNPDNTDFVVSVDSLGEELDDVKVEWVDDIADRKEDLKVNFPR
jgi:hypothetical protein